MEERGNQKFNLNDFIYDNFKLSWGYLKSLKNYIWFSIILFFCFILVGFMLPIFFQEQILKLIAELVRKTEGLGFFGLIKFIFINNLKSSFFAMILGIFLGIVPFIVLVVNGYVLGFVANKTVFTAGWAVLWRLLPHGIFELPAVLISISLGLKLGNFLFVYKGKNKWGEFKKWLIDSLRVFIFIVIPLLIIAGVIEGSLIILLG